MQLHVSQLIMLGRDVGITLKQSTFKGMYQECIELAKPEIKK